MSADHVRETMQQYVNVLLDRGDYRRFFAEDIEVSIVGTDQRARGPEAAERLIRFMHEIAFDARPEISNLVVDDAGAAAEALFVGTHTGEFAGVPASSQSVRVPYSVFYELLRGSVGKGAGDADSAERIRRRRSMHRPRRGRRRAVCAAWYPLAHVQGETRHDALHHRMVVRVQYGRGAAVLRPERTPTARVCPCRRRGNHTR